MIVYGFVRRFVSVRHAPALAAIIYAILFFLMVFSLSQIAADLRYAGV
jgi:hypothetical protein